MKPSSPAFLAYQWRSLSPWTGWANPGSVAMNADKTVTAEFEQNAVLSNTAAGPCCGSSGVLQMGLMSLVALLIVRPVRRLMQSKGAR